MFNINESPDIKTLEVSEPSDIKTLEVSEPSDIKTFEVSEYQYYMENFSSEETLGVISDEKDLLKKVEVIWIDKYGEHIKNEKPYQLFYDEKNDVWLVQGTMPYNVMGGVANILVENDTGKVLAVWHDK